MAEGVDHGGGALAVTAAPVEATAMVQRPAGNAASGDAQALKLLHAEITTRLRYLSDVGIGYLTLDRQSRTLSGGEVQRINLTTALGTSLATRWWWWSTTRP